MAPDDAPSHEPRRTETPAERLDRNWNELLQEFRVAQTGIQILFGFLLILPFQSGFNEIDGYQRVLYLIVFACMTIATACILAPVMAHRILFRKKQKDQLVRLGGALAIASLVFLGTALVGAVALIVSVVADTTAAWVAAGATLLLMLVLWVTVPLALPRNPAEEAHP
jgi:hypothetical protein